MENIDFLGLFQGFGTMVAGGWLLATARIFLIFWADCWSIWAGKACSNRWL